MNSTNERRYNAEEEIGQKIAVGRNILRPVIAVFLTCIVVWTFLFRLFTGGNFLLSAVFGVTAVVSSFLMALWIFRKKMRSSNFPLLAIAIHVFSFPAIVFAYLLVVGIAAATGDCCPSRLVSAFYKLGTVAGFVSFIGAIGLGVKFFEIYGKIREKGALAEARYLSLKDIINPHYLFNVFSSIQAYIWLDKVKAEKMLLLLAEALRYALKSERKHLVPLAEELDYVQKLAELNELQGGGTPKVIRIVRNGDEDFLVPPFGIFVFERFMLKFDRLSSLHSDSPSLMEGKRVGERYLIRYQFDTSGKDWIEMAKLIVEMGKNFWPGKDVEHSINEELKEVRIWLPLKRSK